MHLTRPRLGASRRSRMSLAALAVYCLVSFLFFGLRLLTESGSHYVGYSSDPQIFIWSFAWWPHAILNGENPFITHALWSPSGVDLTWSTSVPGLALLFSPLTLLAGAFVSYNAAAVLLPALAAWTAFQLCRHITQAFWPSLVGGYLFGFSSYMLGQEEGHPHMYSVFLVPVLVLLVLRYLERELDGRGLALRLGPLLAFQLLFSTEVTFTLAVALVCAFALGFALVPDVRGRLVSLIGPFAVGCALAAALTSPFIYYAISGFHSDAFHPPSGYLADLVNFAVPTKLALLARGPAIGISNHFPGNDSERDAYLGLPALLIVALFFWRSWRTAAGRFLLASLGLATIAALGSELTIDGHRLFSMPWALVGDRPLFDNVLPTRLVLYGSLVAAVIVAMWTASEPRGLLRRLLPPLTVLAILPNPVADVWTTSYSIPPFFTDSAYRTCLNPGENVLPLPIGGGGEADLWQVAGDFRFRLAGGNITPNVPPAFARPGSVARVSEGNPIPATDANALISFIEQKHVTSVVVDEGQSTQWSAALDRIATGRHVGGILLYRITGATTGCPRS